MVTHTDATATVLTMTHRGDRVDGYDTDGSDGVDKYNDTYMVVVASTTTPRTYTQSGSVDNGEADTHTHTHLLSFRHAAGIVLTTVTLTRQR